MKTHVYNGGISHVQYPPCYPVLHQSLSRSRLRFYAHYHFVEIGVYTCFLLFTMWITQLEGSALTVGITTTCGTAFMLFGFDQGVFGGILEHPLFQSTFRRPSPMIQGQIVSSYDLGCILGALMTVFVGDVIGRRKTISLGCMFVVLGGIIQSSSYSLPQMIVGRIVAGVGVGMNSVAVPMWQSETCKPEHRGKLIAIQLVLVIGGIALSNWMNLGFSYVTGSDVSWRFPLAFQSFIALVATALVACMPESPRWLCTKDRHFEAQTIIGRLLAKPREDDCVVESLQLIISSISHERGLAKVGWRDIFTNGEQQNFRRIALGAGTSLMQQMGGINVVVYYLPLILTTSFGFDSRQALILSACDFMSLMVWGSVVMLVIDKWGRKKLMLIGALAQGICFAIASAGLGIGTKSSEAVAVTAIFLYHVFFVSSSHKLLFPGLIEYFRAYHFCRFLFAILRRSTASVCETLEAPLQ